jgi:hypothetical protein
MLGYAVSFSSPWRGKQRVFERHNPAFMDQLQPSTNSDKLSDLCLLHPLLAALLRNDNLDTPVLLTSGRRVIGSDWGRLAKPMGGDL